MTSTQWVFVRRLSRVRHDGCRMNSFAREQQRLGLPDEQLSNVRLNFHAARSEIILGIDVIREGIPYSRIYRRHISQELYQLAVPLSDETHSIKGPLVCEAPALFFVLSRWKNSGGATWGEYLAIGRLNLETGIQDLWHTDAPGPTRFFVSELGSATSDGENIFVACGFRPARRTGPIEYALTKLDWSRRTATRLATFSGVLY